jgi:hypothetical protein
MRSNCLNNSMSLLFYLFMKKVTQVTVVIFDIYIYIYIYIVTCISDYRRGFGLNGCIY